MHSHNLVSVWKLIYCVTTTVPKVEIKRGIQAKLRVECGRMLSWVRTGCGSVQSHSLVISLGNEALWSSGSHPSLGPHTSLMFPHHGPDNYWGRECHLSRASSTEDDSTRSVVCQTCVVSCTHAHTASVHTHKHILVSPKSEPYVSSYYTHNTRDAWLFWLCSSRLLNFFFFFIDTQKYLCVKIEGLWEIREGWVVGSGVGNNTRGTVTQVSKFIHTIRSDSFGFGKQNLIVLLKPCIYQYELCQYWI